MNAQMKRMSGIAIAVSLILASAGAWAVGNEITFEGAKSEDSNGVNNTANIDASGGTGVTVNIRQISSGSLSGGNPVLNNAAQMNQVGDYVNNSALAISGTATVKVGQGVKFQAGSPDDFDDATEAGSVNNLVKGNISGGSAFISQTGAAGSRSVNAVSMSGGTLRANQSGDNNALTVTSMTNGNLNVNQSGSDDAVTVTSMTGGTLNANQTGDTEALNVTQFTGGSTTINQGQKGGVGDNATNSTLTFDSGAVGVASNYTNVNVYQNGSNQDAHLTYTNGGYSGDLNLTAHGDAGPPAVLSTLDIKL